MGLPFKSHRDPSFSDQMEFVVFGTARSRNEERVSLPVKRFLGFKCRIETIIIFPNFVPPWLVNE